MAWINDDGLKVRFDAERITRVEGGEYNFGTPLRTIEVEVLGTAIGTTATLIADGVIIPRNSRIESVEVVAETALDALTAFDIGLQRLDYTTELDYDGLVDGALLATVDADGEKTVYNLGSTAAGTLIGETTLYPGRLTILRTGSAATVGKLIIRVNLYVPGADVNVNNY